MKFPFPYPQQDRINQFLDPSLSGMKIASCKRCKGLGNQRGRISKMESKCGALLSRKMRDQA